MKTALITGATSGIGLEIAKSLSKKNWNLLIHGRDPQKLRSACESCAPHVAPFEAELSLLASTRQLAENIRGCHRRIDALVLNAGTVTRRREVTTEGIEQMFSVNHLTPFFLTEELHQLIPTGGQIINISTDAHRWIKTLDLKNLQAEKKFRVLKHYAATKSANLITGLEWSRRLADGGIQVSHHHPGEVATAFGLHGPWWLRLFWKLGARRFISPARAAEPIVNFLAHPPKKLPDTPYFSQGDEALPAPHILDPIATKSLWSLTEKLLHTPRG